MIWLQLTSTKIVSPANPIVPTHGAPGCSHDFDPQIGRAIAEVFHAVMAGTRTGARSCRTDDDGGNTPWRTSSE